MKYKYPFPDMLFDPPPSDEETVTRLEKVIDGILNSKELNIDQPIRALWENGRLHQRWNSYLRPNWDDNHALKFIGRRTLEVALINAGFAAQEMQKTDVISEWKRLSGIAERASEAFDFLLKNFSGNNLSLGSRALQTPLRQMAVHTTKLGPNERFEWARERAEKLLEMQALLKDISDFTAGMRSGLASDHKNPGNPVKTAFVQISAEGWVFLTGKLPGGGSETNPFLQFVESAWEDAGGKGNESFVQSLRTTLPRLKDNQDILAGTYRPLWA